MVRPGGGLEELSRAVAERRLRAVLCGAVRQGEARRGSVSRHPAPVPALGRSTTSDQGPVYLGYRLGHIKGESRVFRALVYNKGAAVLHMLRRLIGDEAFFTRPAAASTPTTASRRPAPTTCARRWKPKAAADLDALLRALDLRQRHPAPAVTARSVEGQELVRPLRADRRGIFDVPVTVTVTYADGKTAEFLVIADRGRHREARFPLTGTLSGRSRRTRTAGRWRLSRRE